MCVGGGGEGVWVVPDSEKATLSTVKNHLRATVILVLLSECFFIGRATYESYNNVASKEIYACFMPSK